MFMLHVDGCVCVWYLMVHKNWQIENEWLGMVEDEDEDEQKELRFASRMCIYAQITIVPASMYNPG